MDAAAFSASAVAPRQYSNEWNNEILNDLNSIKKWILLQDGYDRTNNI